MPQYYVGRAGHGPAGPNTTPSPVPSLPKGYDAKIVKDYKEIPKDLSPGIYYGVDPNYQPPPGMWEKLMGLLGKSK